MIATSRPSQIPLNDPILPGPLDLEYRTLLKSMAWTELHTTKSETHELAGLSKTIMWKLVALVSGAAARVGVARLLIVWICVLHLHRALDLSLQSTLRAQY
jgi:hypothetical protein